jgi:hypothetical protein
MNSKTMEQNLLKYIQKNMAAKIFKVHNRKYILIYYNNEMI